MSVCYDLRFPELYRGLALRGARILTVPAAFTLATTRDHWEVLLRARAIENQAFVVAPNQIGAHPPGMRSGGRSMIVDPWGLVLAVAPDTETDRDRRPRHRSARRRARAAARAAPRPAGAAGLMAVSRPTSGGSSSTRPSACSPGRASHGCRVSDIADEAGVAYGLVYHYFRSKDEVLDTLFLERWNVLLDAIREIDRQDISPREKLHAIASFIIDSYRHDPELMKVIIVEVTRAANSFGQTHLAKIREAYDLIADDRRQGPGRGRVQGRRSRRSSRRWRSTARSSRC